MKGRDTHRVAILATESAALFELGCAVELFGLARPEFDSWYECDVVCLADGPVKTTTGISLNVSRVSSLENYSTFSSAELAG